MSRTLRPLAALAMLALIVAGCSSTSGGTGSSRGSNNTAAAHEKAVKFAECMRANGVSAFPDPFCAVAQCAIRCVGVEAFELGLRQHALLAEQREQTPIEIG
jgi:hypothetical protein